MPPGNSTKMDTLVSEPQMLLNCDSDTTERYGGFGEDRLGLNVCSGKNVSGIMDNNARDY